VTADEPDRDRRATVSADIAPPPEPEAAREPTVSEMVAQQLGGVRGVVEASIPVTVFIIVNLAWPWLRSVTGLLTGVSELRAAIWGAVGSGVLIAAYRLARRDSVRHAINGLVGVAIAAWFAARTGKAEGFYLPGIWYSYGEGAIFLVSALVRRPMVGYGWAMITATHFDWREHPRLVRAFSICTVVFTLAFWTNSSIQLALYFAGMPNALGIARLCGRSLYVGAALLTIWYARRAVRAAEGAGEA
jgi:hypothetical protein